jgi:hypothetical protein
VDLQNHWSKNSLSPPVSQIYQADLLLVVSNNKDYSPKRELATTDSANIKLTTQLQRIPEWLTASGMAISK